MVEDGVGSERAYELTTREIVGLSNAFCRPMCSLWRTSSAVFTAMIALKEGQGSFADAVIAALGCQKGLFLHADVRTGRRCGFQASSFLNSGRI